MAKLSYYCDKFAGQLIECPFSGTDCLLQLKIDLFVGICLLFFTALLSCGFQTGTKANLVAVASFL